MQALMLAAGMGKRLGKFTNNNTKCMVQVAGEKLIDRAIDAIKFAGINKMIIVVGYKGQNLIDYINEKYKNSGFEFKFIFNHNYDNSNNIYSFYMAREYIIQDDTILLESDLIFDKVLIKNMLDNPYKDLVAVAKYKSWMDGTVITCDKEGFITQFVDKIDMDYNLLSNYFKTVNVYKLSKEFCQNVYVPFLEAYMKAYGKNSYYETTLKAIAHLSKTKLKAYEIGDMDWYEIDDAQDLDIANAIFSHGEDKYNLLISKFGGYWRYDNLLDFCYLVNPYFPTKAFLEKFQRELPKLLGAYPSGLNTQNMNAERIFNVDKNYILVGNGASELINALGYTFEGNIALGVPTFNEYVRCFRNCNIYYVDNSQWDYQTNLHAYMNACDKAELLCVISPDNPSGAMLSYEEAIQLIDYACQKNTKILIDESFIDFAEPDKKYTLLNNDLLEKYPNLIVVKSIGKSYGVAGLRLGIIASSNLELLKNIKNNMQIWNINSFAEYYLQIYNLYAKDYTHACELIAHEREYMYNELCNIDSIKVYKSQANYLMIDLGKTSSKEFCIEILDKYNILLKDLSTKQYFNNKNFIRVAIKNNQENKLLLEAIKDILHA